jgi:CRISPR-associated protein Cmr3
MSGAGWKAFRLAPNDLLYFGDGRPSNMGEDHYLRSIFPPLPSTLYGAIRTRRLLDAGVDLSAFGKRGDAAVAQAWAKLPQALRDELGEFGSFGTLELRGPWLERDGLPMFPAPSDLGLLMSPCARSDGQAQEKIGEVLRFRTPENAAGGAFSHALLPLMPHRRKGGGWELVGRDEEPESAAGWYLTLDGMKVWAAGGVPGPGDFVPCAELWVDEVRTGVGLQAATRAAEEHKLFTFGFIRLKKGVTLGFEVSGTSLEAGGALRLGGDGRTAVLEPGRALALPKSASAGGPFALYFATATLSETGAFPPGVDPGTLKAKWGGKGCALVAGAVKASLPCGGFDMRVRQQKPLRRAIPAGSVFHFDGDPAVVHATNLCGYESEHFARQGYGFALTGARK